jgi:hypothetical protein
MKMRSFCYITELDDDELDISLNYQRIMRQGHLFI